MEAVECGAAALGIILRTYGRVVPLEVLRRDCGVSRDGSNAANVVRAAQHYGLDAKGLKQDIPGLQALRPPYIIFWFFNHFLVVEGFGRGCVYLNDPASGRRRVSLREFNEGFTGVVLVMEPGPTFSRGGREPSVRRALRERLRGSVQALVFCAVIGLLLALPRLAVPAFSQIFVDQVLIQGLQDWVRPLLIGMLLTAGLHGLLLRLQLRYLRRLKVKLAVGMASRFIWHLLHLPASYYAQRFSGEISSRVPLNDTVADVLSGRLATTMIDSLMLVLSVALMLQYDTLLTALSIAAAGLNVVALQCIARKRTDATMRLASEYGKVAGVSIAGLQSMETLKASALESAFFARWAGYCAKAVNVEQELALSNQQLTVLPTFVASLIAILVLVLGGLRVMDGHLSIGMLVAFQGLLSQFLKPVTTLVDLGSTVQTLRSDLLRLDDVLRHPLDPDLDRPEAPARTPLEPYRLEGAITLQHLTFGYNPLAPPLIEDLSLTLRPGQRVAFVGASGSGKSTMARLLSGLYQPWSGTLLYDGLPRAELPREVLTQSLALVEQEILLFAGSVRDNLTLWDATVPDADLVQACKDAAIHDVITALPGGYDAQLIEGGANLSGGQRQRLEIARALVSNPALLVMDEATSALDAETESLIMQNLCRRRCTCVIVAHRLSTIRDCDEILVLEQGKVVERGTHDQLMQLGRAYRRLIALEGEALPEEAIR
jgi:NHLM bacteriocin system ABC transporter peptidase/ATP-binding protein